MATDTVTIDQFINANRISLTAERTDSNPSMENSRDMDNWKVTLRHASKRMTLIFSKGIGHKGAEPTASEVLDCLASDSSTVANTPTFEDFCSEFGYDTDSRSAERTFKACRHQDSRLRKFLGHDLYEQLLWNTERM